MCNGFKSTAAKVYKPIRTVVDPLNIMDPLRILPGSSLTGKPFTYDKNYGGALAKWYRDSTRPQDTSSVKYEYVPPAKTQQSLYTYDAGQNYQPVQQAAYQPTEENNTVKVIEEDSDRTKISNT